jgi:4-hydroxybenzoate polyprenyltransferase
LCAGASLIYTGGMYLNDACDSHFDALHRSGRPIPSGAIQRRTVWILSCVLLGIGALLLVLLGKTTALITLGLLGCIIFYDVVHKKTILSPVVMAGCRFLLYLVAASAASAGINKATLWSAVALAAYVIGLSYLARKESSHARINPWSLLFLLTPVLIACLMDDLNFKVVMLSVIFLAWIAWCLRPILARKTGAIGQTVSGLLAGIVLLDLLAVQGGPGLMPLVFIFLFGSALLFQRAIPAT